LSDIDRNNPEIGSYFQDLRHYSTFVEKDVEKLSTKKNNLALLNLKEPSE
jgi:hypothetical protein